MTKYISIQLKAAFLIIVFSSNSIMGFACCIGIDMVFNLNHKSDATEVTRHIPVCCKKHETEIAHHHKAKGGKGNCCNDVLKISQSDKSVPQSSKGINPGFFTLLVSSFYNPDIVVPSHQNKSIKYFVRIHHPPAPDIRIAIRSFQI